MKFEAFDEDTHPYRYLFTDDEAGIMVGAFQHRVNEFIQTKQNHKISLLDADVANWDIDEKPMALQLDTPIYLGRVLLDYTWTKVEGLDFLVANSPSVKLSELYEDGVIPIDALKAIELAHGMSKEYVAHKLIKEFQNIMPSDFGAPI